MVNPPGGSNENIKALDRLAHGTSEVWRRTNKEPPNERIIQFCFTWELLDYPESCHRLKQFPQLNYELLIQWDEAQACHSCSRSRRED